MPGSCTASGAGSSFDNNPREAPAERIASEPKVTLEVADALRGAVSGAAESPCRDDSPTAARGISNGETQ